MSTTSWSSLLVRWYVTYIRRSKPIYSSAPKTRALLAQLYLRPEPYEPPPSSSRHLGPGVVVERVDVSDWPLYRISPSSSSPSPPDKDNDDDNDNRPRDAMLYIHGGAWIHEAAPLHWSFAAQVARQTGLDVLLPVYPLLPRPTATAGHIVDGLVGIIRDVTKHRIISIAGDSAGGCLALATAQHLSRSEPDLAAAVTSLVLISPVLDCALDHPETVALDGVDPWLGIEGLRELIPYYTGRIHDNNDNNNSLQVSDPVVSPLFGDLSALPPTLLLCGTHDILCSDARRLSARFQGKCKCECKGDDDDDGDDEEEEDKGAPGSIETKRFTYVEQPEMVHVYPLLPHWEGRQARDVIVAFVSKHLV